MFSKSQQKKTIINQEVFVQLNIDGVRIKSDIPDISLQKVEFPEVL